jgi:hypothetical protein
VCVVTHASLQGAWAAIDAQYEEALHTAHRLRDERLAQAQLMFQAELKAAKEDRDVCVG